MIPKENRARIIAALKDNPNAKKVAREVGGASYRTVVRLAKGAGIELTAGKAAQGRDRPSLEKRAEIIAALKDNPNTLQVARQVGGVSHWTVGKIAKAAGIELAAAINGKRLSAAKRAQIIIALQANPNAAEVAKQIGGVTGVGVWKIAKAAGIELTAGKAARGHRGKSTSDRSLRKRCRKEKVALLRIFIGENDRFGQHPLYEAIVLKAREQRLAGATVLRGPMGFGHSSRLHTAKILRLSEDLPVVVEIIDSEKNITAFLPLLEEMVKGGLVSIEEVRILRYVPDRKLSSSTVAVEGS